MTMTKRDGVVADYVGITSFGVSYSLRLIEADGDVSLTESTYVQSGMIPRGGIRRHSRTRRGMHAPRCWESNPSSCERERGILQGPKCALKDWLVLEWLTRSVSLDTKYIPLEAR